MNKKKLKEMQQKSWWNYALLVAGIFVYTQGCSILKSNLEFAIPVIIFGLLMHSNSLKKIIHNLLLKEKDSSANTDKYELAYERSSFIAKIILFVLLGTFAFFSFGNPLHIYYNLIFDIAVVAIYGIVSISGYKVSRNKK
ncbi:hypothetical protein [Sedimentibacter sp. MB31-C6]|uniref:hypothetical protein n=1 Tax=Sedimentibacter sp. MB31-C6 TaxID=3109366 RepID=UPI002DDD047D|nr:hypothetical protein [Sedimentibacter sp. MB36-C1]WSI02990.1 hypothetical protein U8307_08005 [Sedimentibacter sp. MB36-C1]